MINPRSQLDGRWAGEGTARAYLEPDEMYVDRKVAVRFPSDAQLKINAASLSGPVTTYNLYTGARA